MFKIPGTIKNKILSAFDDIQSYLNKNHLNELLKCGIPVYHYLVLQKISETEFKEINNIELIMLCGAFDFVFDIKPCPNHYPYSFYEMSAFERLDDAITELNHFIKYSKNK